MFPWKYVAANFWNLNSDKSSSSLGSVCMGLMISCWSGFGAGRSFKENHDTEYTNNACPP